MLDCFAGSGTILEAAHELKVKATALELKPEHYGMCLTRLRELDKPRDTKLETQLGMGGELSELIQKGKQEWAIQKQAERAAGGAR